MACKRKSGNTRSQAARSVSARKFRMSPYSTHRLNYDTSRIMLCSLHLPRITSTAPQESRGNHLPSLLRTQARGTCKLRSLLPFFPFAQARALIRGFLISLLSCVLSLCTEIMCNGVWWSSEHDIPLTPQSRWLRAFAGGCAVSDIRSGGWISEHS